MTASPGLGVAPLLLLGAGVLGAGALFGGLLAWRQQSVEQQRAEVERKRLELMERRPELFDKPGDSDTALWLALGAAGVAALLLVTS